MGAVWEQVTAAGVNPLDNMISRGEVALIVAQKGEQAGLISSTLFPAIVLVVIVTTLITPILLKAVVYMKEQKKVDAIAAR